jgi:hypothetical protein
LKSNDIGITTFAKLFMVKTYKDFYGSRLMVGNILETHIPLGPTFRGANAQQIQKPSYLFLFSNL